MLATLFLRWLSHYQHCETFWVAYSGGLDSHVLLHLFSQAKSQLIGSEVKAIHINHGLSPHAKKWEEHCARVCQALSISCSIIQVDASAKSGESREESARKARYQAFGQLLNENDCLATGHHQDDQAETLLLQLFRGSGIKGLAAMPEVSTRGKGLHLRPLLPFSRHQLEDYAKLHQLNWITDESNFDTSFERNFIRHNLLPILKARRSTIAATLARSAKHCAEADQLLQEFVSNDFRQVFNEENNTLAIAQLKKMSVIRQQYVIRYWLQFLKLPLPSTAVLAELINHVMHAGQDAIPSLTWADVIVRRFKGSLYAEHYTKHEQLHPISWDLTAPLILPHGLGILHAKKTKGKGLRVPSERVEVRFRAGGERFQPQGRIGSHPLKKLLQEWDIPPWQRAAIPLIYLDNKLVIVVGYGIAEGAGVVENEWGWEILAL